tara:strand:+ start:6355 stop:6543 length:189 start_codon:yes stop_codon:yes gene_type:complete
MNSFIMMFGEPTPPGTHTGTMPKHIIKTPQGTFKACINRDYIGTYKKIEQAINAVSKYLKQN